MPLHFFTVQSLFLLSVTLSSDQRSLWNLASSPPWRISSPRFAADLEFLLLEMTAKSITVAEDLGRFLAEDSQSTMVTASGILSSCYGKERMMMFMMNIKESVDLNIFRCTSIFRCTISIRFAEKIPMVIYLGLSDLHFFLLCCVIFSILLAYSISTSMLDLEQTSFNIWFLRFFLSLISSSTLISNKLILILVLFNQQVGFIKKLATYSESGLIFSYCGCFSCWRKLEVSSLL